MDITTVFGTVIGGSNPSGSTLENKELNAEHLAPYFLAPGGIRKPQPQGPSV